MIQTAYGYAMPMQCDTEPRAAAEKLKRYVEDYYRYKYSHIRWVGVFIDGPASARTPLLRRKAGCEMLKRAERGDHIILSSLSIAFHTLLGRGILNCPRRYDSLPGAQSA